MKNKLLISFALLLITLFAGAQQFNKLGNPLITNFTSNDFNGMDQTWSLIKDDRGIMYFGSWENGILEYDGINWRKIPTPDNIPVYSLAKGDDGTLYVGSDGNFGILQPTKQGGLEFVSLLQFVEDSIKTEFSEIYKTYFNRNKAYFCSELYIFVYDGNSVETIRTAEDNKTYPFLTFIVNDVVYVGTYGNGLQILDNGKLTPAPGAETFKGKNIYSMLPMDNGNILVVTLKGFFSYNPTTGKSSNPLHEQACQLITKLIDQGAVPYNSIELFNGHRATGNLLNEWAALLEFDEELHPTSIVNKEVGLQSNQITNLFQDGDNPVWTTFLNVGISKIELNSNIRRFGAESGLDDLITGIIRFNGTLYVSTMSGVYYLKHGADGIPRFHSVKNISGLIWSLMEFKISNGKSKLLAGSHSDGVFEIIGDKAYSISKKFTESDTTIQHNVYTLYQSQSHPERLYIGMTNNLALISWNNGWISNTRPTTLELSNTKISYDIRDIAEDSYGNLWIKSISRGLKVITPNNYLIDFAAHKDLSNSKEISFITSNDTLFFVSDEALYTYNYQDSTFTKGGMVNPLSKNKGFRRIRETDNGYIASCTDHTGAYFAQLIEKDSLENWTLNPVPFKRLPGKTIDAIFVDSTDGTIWLGLGDELFSYNPNFRRNFKASYPALIRRVIAKDSLLFDGAFYSLTSDNRRVISTTQQPVQIHKLPFTLNALEIQFSSPYFEREEDLVYSHYLEGSDEVTWSKWDNRTDAIYTNLREGKYTFHLKAKNVYGQESTQATYSFEILPPWYRSIWAFILYGLLSIAFVWGIVKWNTRRLEEEKKRLEEIVRQRTAEVVAQKEEIESQNEKIATQNEEIKSSIHYASRIQSAILTPEEQVVNIFPDHFILYLPRDIVSGDFYYMTQIGNKKVCVIADCTGHGVPGGFMSMLGISFLNQIISQSQELHPATILYKLRQQVISALHQTSEIGGSKDGMDLALFILDETTMKVEFAGANNPLIHISNGEINQLKGDKMPIGIHVRDKVNFENVEIEVKKGDLIYAFSDGYADQFGGPLGRKFMTKTFRELLLQIHQKPMDEQREILHQTLIDWHGDTPRVDDVVVMGVKI